MADAEAKKAADDRKEDESKDETAVVKSVNASTTKYGHAAVTVEPGSFESENHFYTKVVNAQIHPLVAYFLSLSNERLISRYCHLYPKVSSESLQKLLEYKPREFRWAGADLFYVTTSDGRREMIVIETNSCPSGQKSFPQVSEKHEANGYRVLIKRTFVPMLKERSASGNLPEGGLAVIFDKNPMEASGYAAAIADVLDEPVYLVEWYDKDENPKVRWTADMVLEVQDAAGVWHRIRAAFRYVTQKPWNRIPLQTSRTLILNPTIACLCGGRNKLMASKAYDFFNSAECNKNSQLQIRTPETVRDLPKDAVPFWVKSFGGYAVVKVPYSNAGQGVYTITNEEELNNFMNEKTGSYDQYIVQALVGDSGWSSNTRHGQFFHVGTVPDRQKKIYCVDIRMMVHFDMKLNQFRPLALYSRRARKPLVSTLLPGMSSWDILGTNLSVATGNNEWVTETSRLLIMDRRDFNRLGLSLDDLLDAYIQTVMSCVAIDQLCCQLSNEDGTTNMQAFASLNNDQALLDEIMI